MYCRYLLRYSIPFQSSSICLVRSCLFLSSLSPYFPRKELTTTHSSSVFLVLVTVDDYSLPIINGREEILNCVAGAIVQLLRRLLLLYMINTIFNWSHPHPVLPNLVSAGLAASLFFPTHSPSTLPIHLQTLHFLNNTPNPRISYQ